MLRRKEPGLLQELQVVGNFLLLPAVDLRWFVEPVPGMRFELAKDLPAQVQIALHAIISTALH
jgi:hypothetical protein